MCYVIRVIKSNPTRPVGPITQHIGRAEWSIGLENYVTRSKLVQLNGF